MTLAKDQFRAAWQMYRLVYRVARCYPADDFGRALVRRWRSNARHALRSLRFESVMRDRP